MSRRKQQYVRNLKIVSPNPNGDIYYYYRMPDGSLATLGKNLDLDVAAEAAIALNLKLEDKPTLTKLVLEHSQTLTQYNPSNPPMNQVIDEYRESVLKTAYEEGRQSKGTVEIKGYKLLEYNEAWGNKRVQSIRTYDLVTFLKTKSGHVQAKHGPLLRDLFRYAIGEGYRDTNPAVEINLKSPEKRRRQRHTFEGYQKVKAAAPDWLKRAMDIALFSVQRRSDLVEIDILTHINQAERTIDILQQKTRTYANPVYISIKMGDSLWEAVESAIKSPTKCPKLIHCKPGRSDRRDIEAKSHAFAVLPDYLTKQFRKYRDASGAYDHLEKEERPSFHDIRALGILMYHKAGYPMDYIMALAGHAKQTTTEHYIEGHEKPKPVSVAAGLDLSKIDINEIDWQDAKLPIGLAGLVEDD